MNWTSERVDELQDLRSEGLSFGEIGAKMGVSRNAIIGKANRLGLLEAAEDGERIEWTAEREELLKTLWNAGDKFRDIKMALATDISDRVIRKKARSLGLLPRLRAKNKGNARLKKPRRWHALGNSPESERTAPTAPTVSVEDTAIPVAQRKSLDQLTDTSCRWPVGDPQEPDFFFCGAPIECGPYCASHHARAYRGEGRTYSAHAFVLPPTVQRVDPI